MLKYLLEKEFKQILRNKFLSKLIFVLPVTTIVIFPFVTNQDVQDVKLAVVDQDRSPLSERLVQKASDSGYFRLADVSPIYEEAMRSVETGDADIVFQIPQDFERDLYRDGAAQVLIAANSVNGTRGALGAQYLASVVRDYNQEIRLLSGGANTSAVAELLPDVRIRYRFNPELEYKVFMVPGLIMMLLTILGCALTALNIVGEKEAGTIEQINVSPVSKRLFILAKLMPNWIIGFIALAFGMTFGWLVHGVAPVGNLLTILLFTLVYVFVTTGIGMVISNYSDTMQQAMFVMFFFLVIMMLTSGLFTPVESMPLWMQRATAINPLQYFAGAMRLVYLKGSGFAEMLSPFGWLCGFALVFNVWAVVSYKKKS